MLAGYFCTVDLKYITCAQILEVIYEGRRRRFSVDSISSQLPSGKEQLDGLVRGLGSLSVASSTKLWTVGWDCTVSILDKEVKDPALATHKVISTQRQTKILVFSSYNPWCQPEIEVLAPSTTNDAYSTVGGLNKQIQQIRDLLEIPLTRPELFRYFGPCFFSLPPGFALAHHPPFHN